MKLKLFFLAVIAMLYSSSCIKDPMNPIYDNANLAQGSYLSITETINLNLDFQLETSSVGLKVKSVGSPADKIEMYVVMGSSLDATTWKYIKTVTYSGEGTELSATNAEIEAALGEDIQPGAQYTIYDRVITTDGRTFDMTNISDAESAADYHMAMRWTINAVAPYTGNMAGDYEVLQDDWADYGEGDIIVGAVEDGPAENQITLHVYPNLGAYPDAIVYDPIVVDIDPESGVATVNDVHYGDYGGGYDMSCAGDGYVFSATGTIDLTLNQYIGDPELGSQGSYRLVLQKQ